MTPTRKTRKEDSFDRSSGGDDDDDYEQEGETDVGLTTMTDILEKGFRFALHNFEDRTSSLPLLL